MEGRVDDYSLNEAIFPETGHFGEMNFWLTRSGSIINFIGIAGLTQLVECQLPKLNVAGSSPVLRSLIEGMLTWMPTEIQGERHLL